MLELLQLLFTGTYDRVFFGFVTMIIVGAAVWDIKNRKFPPGPTGLPFLGYLPSLNSKTPYKQLTNLTRQFGRVYGLQLGSVYSVVVADVKLIKEVIAKSLFKEKSSIYLLNGLGQQNGVDEIVNDDGKVTLALKNVIEKSIIQKDRIGGQIQESLRQFLEDLRIGLGQEQEVTFLLKNIVGQLITGIIIGKRFERTDQYWPVLEASFEQTSKVGGVTSAINYIPILRKMPNNAKTIQNLICIRQKCKVIYKEIIEQNLQESMRLDVEQSILGEYLNEVKKCGGLDIVDSEDLSQVFVDIVNDEWEMTLTTLKWIYLYMALYPDIQENVACEVEKVCGKKHEITLDDLELLPYTEATVLEIWRHQTVFPFGVPRAVKKKTKIGDYEVPGDTLVIPLLWAVNHDSRVWENPEIFSPERFLFEDGRIFRNENLLPSQTGSRAIFGDSLSRWTACLFLANTLNEFHITFPIDYGYNVVEDFTLETTVVPKPYHLLLCKRYK